MGGTAAGRRRHGSSQPGGGCSRHRAGSRGKGWSRHAACGGNRAGAGSMRQWQARERGRHGHRLCGAAAAAGRGGVTAGFISRLCHRRHNTGHRRACGRTFRAACAGRGGCRCRGSRGYQHRVWPCFCEPVSGPYRHRLATGPAACGGAAVLFRGSERQQAWQQRHQGWDLGHHPAGQQAAAQQQRGRQRRRPGCALLFSACAWPSCTCTPARCVAPCPARAHHGPLCTSQAVCTHALCTHVLRTSCVHSPVHFACLIWTCTLGNEQYIVDGACMGASWVLLCWMTTHAQPFDHGCLSACHPSTTPD